MTTTTVTLYCEIGEHEWERPSQRGKRPKSCPEHKPQPEKQDGPKLSKEERQKRMLAGRKAAKAERDKDGIERVLVWREWLREDAALWLRYQQGELTRDQWLKQKPKMDG